MQNLHDPFKNNANLSYYGIKYPRVVIQSHFQHENEINHDTRATIITDDFVVWANRRRLLSNSKSNGK